MTATVTPDLSFAPVQNPAPNRLSAAESARYNRDGFVQPFDVFGAGEIDAIRAYADGLRADREAAVALGIN